ncbi:uncharacterized protein LOC119589603 [Penaeus monodon]|uniref:uncharacterized protein LOC119589603 n=1 Tax=Penaeus monodon TaxID=6687 RepID=UPI0018A7B711|nr:uncharacterized protein LOC119589603 [Penaeus monodon]
MPIEVSLPLLIFVSRRRADYHDRGGVVSWWGVGHCSLLASFTGGDTTTHQIVTETPQVIKSSLGQFVVLQQNQNSLSLGSMNNRIITSGGQVVTTMSGLGNSNSNKPVVVNAAQLGGALRQQIVVTQPATVPQQVRTVQVKQPQQTQSHNSGTVTKVIITSQAGGSLGSLEDSRSAWSPVRVVQVEAPRWYHLPPNLHSSKHSRWDSFHLQKQ